MISEDMILPFMILLCAYPLLFYNTGIAIKHHEVTVVRFYWALREKYPRSYIKQTRPVSYIRRRFGMDHKGTIHWMICVFHYLQFLALPAPIIGVVLYFVFPWEHSIAIVFTIGFFPLTAILIIGKAFAFVQYARCNRIKKKDLRYAKAELIYHNRCL